MPLRFAMIVVAHLVGILVGGACFAQVDGGGPGKIAFHLEILDPDGVRTALAPGKTSKKSDVFAFDRAYLPGDQMVFSDSRGGSQQVAAKVDVAEPECLLYLKGPAKFEIPYGREEKQTGSAYAPEVFAGTAHQVALRQMSKAEILSYRNLALNPCDTLVTDTVFPHASTNSYSRNLFDFAARNAIDGITQNGHHGVWPFQSWGPGLRTDLWWQVDFGRPVEVDKIRMMVRADFPHDSYWKSARVEFSDGSEEDIQLVAVPGFQDFRFKKRKVAWLRLTNLVPADETRWCSLIEVEAWGRDLN